MLLGQAMNSKYGEFRCLVHTDNGHAHTNFYFSGFVLTKSSLKLEQHFLTFRTDNIRGLGPTWRHLLWTQRLAQESNKKHKADKPTKR